MPAGKLAFPIYNPKPIENIRIPDVDDASIRQTLADCWERTKGMTVPQFQDSECEVRRLWDEAVAEAMGWDAEELAHLRGLLHNEPHVRGLGYGQYADAVDIKPADRERFRKLADQWEHETILLSSTDQVTEHHAHREIVSMGEPAVPLILERMQSAGRTLVPRAARHYRRRPHKPRGTRHHRRDAGSVAGLGRTPWVRIAGRSCSPERSQT